MQRLSPGKGVRGLAGHMEDFAFSWTDTEGTLEAFEQTNKTHFLNGFTRDAASRTGPRFERDQLEEDQFIISRHPSVPVAFGSSHFFPSTLSLS